MTRVSKPNSSHQSAADNPAGPAPMMITSCISDFGLCSSARVAAYVRALPKQLGPYLCGHRFGREARGGGRGARVEELQSRSQFASVRLPTTSAVALQLVQAFDEFGEVAARDARANDRHGPRVVRVVNAVTPATAQRRCDEEDAPARVVRDGRVGRGVSRRLEARLAVEVGRERDDGQARLFVLRDARTTAREALKRRLDCGPRLAPKRLVLVRAREHAFDFRQDEFVSMAFINVRAA